MEISAEQAAESRELERKIKITQEEYAREQWADDLRHARYAITTERIAVLEFAVAALIKSHPAQAQVRELFEGLLEANPDTFRALTGDSTRTAMQDVIDMIFSEQV